MAQRVTLLDQGDSPYSAQDTDNIIALDDPFTMDDTFDVVLPDPTAIVTGRILSVKDQTGSLTVNRKIVVTSNGGALIDGNASLDLTNPYLSYTFYTDHANWYTLSAN
jgi:hypothetical protein